MGGEGGLAGYLQTFLASGFSRHGVHGGIRVGFPVCWYSGLLCRVVVLWWGIFLWRHWGILIHFAHIGGQGYLQVTRTVLHTQWGYPFCM